ncbi:hypothetical protein C8R43DRAFT_1112902 [Mycena crocata]|nr:hypothetical protein C8R43DRAFT_1112902 [Mycena crocata]
MFVSNCVVFISCRYPTPPSLFLFFLVLLRNAMSEKRPCYACQDGDIHSPRPSTGHFTPKNWGKFFQACTRNTFNKETPCPVFFWRPDIPSLIPPWLQSPSTPTPPSSSTHVPSQSQAPHIDLQTYPSPHSQPHATPRKKKQPCTNTACLQGGRSGHLHSQCISHLCKVCCQLTGIHCPAPRHNEPVTSALNSFTVVPRLPSTQVTLTSSTPSTPSIPSIPSTSYSTQIPFTYERPLAKAIDPSYAAKTLRGDHDPTFHDPTLRNTYRRDTPLTIYWWIQDDTEAVTLKVSAPAYPWFDPKLCETLRELIGIDNCLRYVYWDGHHWVYTDVAVKIKGGKHELYARSRDVTKCIGGPEPTSKRRLSDDPLETPTPSRTRLSTSKHPIISPLKYPNNSQESSSVISLSSDESNIQDFPEITSAPSLSTSSETRIWKGHFPMKYAIDMDNGFRAMELLNGGVPKNFEDTFDARFVRGTYYAHHKPWEAMREHKLLKNAIECGKSSGGDWTSLRRRFDKAKLT